MCIPGCGPASATLITQILFPLTILCVSLVSLDILGFSVTQSCFSGWIQVYPEDLFVFVQLP